MSESKRKNSRPSDDPGPDAHIDSSIRLTGVSQLSTAAARALERVRSGGERLARSEIAPILRVIAVDQSVLASGLTVTLVQVAIQEGGCRLLFRLEAEGPGTPAPEAPQLRVIECTVRDDQARVYDVGAAPWSSADAVGRLTFSPAPPHGTREMTFAIDRVEEWTLDALMGSDGKPANTREGPWAFRFSVESD